MLKKHVISKVTVSRKLFMLYLPGALNLFEDSLEGRVRDEQYS